MRRCVLFLLVFLFPCLHNLWAQSEDDALWRELLEQWAEQNDSETVPDDVVEHLQDLIDNPVNLNDTSSEELLSLPFLTDFHRRAICAYIVQNGEMVSMNELYLLNGIDSVTLRLLRYFVKVEPVASDNVGLGELLRRGHSNLIVGGKGTVPQSRGYVNDAYEGSPLRVYYRYYFKSGDRISFQLSGEKDAGEAFALGNKNDVQRYGFDYYGYHLLLRDFGRLKSFIVGKYHLQFGQGATLWSGYAPWMSGAMPLRRYGVGIRPASAFCEYGYLRGAAATVSLLPVKDRNALEMTLFYSNVDRDATASPVDTAEDAVAVFQSLSQTGLHRTESELRRKGELKEQLYGGHLQFRNRNLVVGATTYATLLSNEVQPVPNAYNYFAFRGKENRNYGLDAAYGWRRLQVFGEIAASTAGPLTDTAGAAHYLPIAAVVGVQMQLNSNNFFSVAYRYGSPNYRNLHANMIGQSSSVANEESLLMYYRTRLPFYINMTTSVDFFHYPTPRYNVYSPSSGVDYRLDLSKTVARNTLVDLQYKYKQSERNTDGQLYGVESIRYQQLRMSLEYKPSQIWRLLSRVVCSWFDCEEHQPEKGFLIFQEVDWNSSVGKRPLVLGMRMSLFDISDYDARIYSYESDLTYEYGVPMLMGRGLRAFIVCRYELSSNISMALKYSMNYYPDAESIGSGNDKIEGNRKQEIKVQLRWRF